MLSDVPRMPGASFLRVPQESEADIQRGVLKVLRIHPAVWRAWRVNSGAAVSHYTDSSGRTRRHFVRFNGQAGHSDLAGVFKGGRAFFIEVKRPGENPTPLQQSFLDDMQAGGAFVACVHSVDEAHAALQRV